RAAQRRQRTGVVPTRRADGAPRAGSRGVRARPAALAVHAVRPRRPPRLAGPPARGHPRRRHRAHPDRRPRRAPPPGRDARGLRGPHRPARGRQHQLQHRRTPDGRPPARRPRMLRVRADRPPRHRPVHGEAPMSAYTVVVPTVARPSLRTLLLALAAAKGPEPRRLVLVDDRPRPGRLRRLPDLPFPCEVLRSYGRGPAAARNLGWRAADTEWVAFLDDDVIPSTTWFADLDADL